MEQYLTILHSRTLPAKALQEMSNLPYHFERGSPSSVNIVTTHANGDFYQQFFPISIGRHFAY